jgi:hypothetical protein
MSWAKLIGLAGHALVLLLAVLAWAGCNSATAAPEQPPGNISGDRIVAQYIEAQDGARAFVGWWDSERDERCTWTVAADGVTRCLPSGGLQVMPSANGFSQVVYYSDPECTKALAVSWDDSCENRHIAIRLDDSSCPTRSIVYSVEDEPYQGTMYGLHSDDDCVPMGPAADWQYATTGEVPASAFVGEVR